MPRLRETEALSPERFISGRALPQKQMATRPSREVPDRLPNELTPDLLPSELRSPSCTSNRRRRPGQHPPWATSQHTTRAEWVSSCLALCSCRKSAWKAGTRDSTPRLPPDPPAPGNFHPGTAAPSPTLHASHDGLLCFRLLPTLRTPLFHSRWNHSSGHPAHSRDNASGWQQRPALWG